MVVIKYTLVLSQARLPDLCGYFISAGEKALSDGEIHDRDIQWLERADGSYSLRDSVSNGVGCHGDIRFDPSPSQCH